MNKLTMPKSKWKPKKNLENILYTEKNSPSNFTEHLLFSR